MRRALRVIVQLVLGLIFSSHDAPIGRTGGFRYAWPGAHPLVASAEIGFALLLLLFAKRSEIGFSRRWRERSDHPDRGLPLPGRVADSVAGGSGLGARTALAGVPPPSPV
jgi:hypothetical protein